MREINSNDHDIFIDPEEELNNSLNQNDSIVINCHTPTNYDFQPLKDIPYLKNHQNIYSLSKKIFNNDEPSLIEKTKELKSTEIFFNIEDSLPSKNEANEKNNSYQNALLYENKSRNKHTKFSDDNIRRKCKVLVLNYVKEFINEKIDSIYKSNPKKGINKQKLLFLNKNQVNNSKIKDNKDFMKKSLAEIFSDSISTRYNNSPENSNEILIKGLMNEKDEAKRIFFQRLFNLNFLECVEHFVNKNPNEILKGMKTFEQMKNNSLELKKKKIVKEDDNYLDILEYYLNNYEKILDGKKPRKIYKKKVKSK